MDSMNVEASLVQRHWPVIALVGILVCAVWHCLPRTIPTAGYRWWKPDVLLRLQFLRGGRTILVYGYKQLAGSLFLVRKLGADIVVLPPGLADEVRTITKDSVRSIEPWLHDFASEHVGGHCFLESDLATRMVQQKLTPRLNAVASSMLSELNYALEDEFCQLPSQTMMDMNSVVALVIARVSSRIILGPDESSNTDWLECTTQYTKSLFLTGMILRLVPHCLRPLVVRLLPSHQQLVRSRADARRIIGDIVHRRQSVDDTKAPDSDNLLFWMMQSAKGRERDIDDLAQRTLLLSLSSIHTTAITAVQALYDLIENPQYIDILRQEVIDTLHQQGNFDKKAIDNFHKMDSTLRESQRINPVFLLTFNRIYHEGLHLSNGSKLAAGTRVATASHAAGQDPNNVPGDPSVFNPFRYSDKRRQDPSNQYLFANSDAWGRGRWACPGRFYASMELKMVLAVLLLRYDFAFLPGCRRPRNFTVDSDMYPDRAAKLLIKKREVMDAEIERMLRGEL